MLRESAPPPGGKQGPVENAGRLRHSRLRPCCGFTPLARTACIGQTGGRFKNCATDSRLRFEVLVQISLEVLLSQAGGGVNMSLIKRGASQLPRALFRLFPQWGGAALHQVLDLVFPPACAGCGRPVQASNLLCGGCWGEMEWIERPYCVVSGLPFSLDLGGDIVSPDAIANPPVYDRARSVARFSETARKLVHQLKYHDRLDLAQTMAGWMVRAGADCLRQPDSLIVPVPLHHVRLWRRRYNQAGLLAQAIALQSGLCYAPHLLKRVKATRQQVGLSEQERHANVRGAFELGVLPSEGIAGRTIVLVDDVWTTGATLEACCRLLRRAGVGQICILTFARVVEPLQKTI